MKPSIDHVNTDLCGPLMLPVRMIFSFVLYFTLAGTKPTAGISELGRSVTTVDAEDVNK